MISNETAILTLETQALLFAEEGSLFSQSCMVAIEAIRKQEKYRWHDLRKNPNDLPENKDECIECIVKHIEMSQDIYGDDFEYYTYSDATYDGGTFKFGTGFNQSDLSVMNVIAWKEIEPFEEDNENE